MIYRKGRCSVPVHDGDTEAREKLERDGWQGHHVEFVGPIPTPDELEEVMDKLIADFRAHGLLP